MIAAAAENAAKVVANSASSAAESLQVKNAGDHDTLITLVGSVANLDAKLTEKFNDLKGDLSDIKDGSSKQLGDHETRIRNLEHQRWAWAGGLTVVAVIVPILVNYVLHLISKG